MDVHDRSRLPALALRDGIGVRHLPERVVPVVIAVEI